MNQKKSVQKNGGFRGNPRIHPGREEISLLRNVVLLTTTCVLLEAADCRLEGGTVFARLELYATRLMDSARVIPRDMRSQKGQIAYLPPWSIFCTIKERMKSTRTVPSLHSC